MPLRKIVFGNDEIYHAYNRSINSQSIFEYKRNCERALKTISFYQFHPLPVSLSHYLKISQKEKKIIDNLLSKSKKLTDILSFCLMPNHFHFLLRQKIKEGISKFLANFQNSYTRYFNIFHDRNGHLFEGQFKAVRIETDDQLLHVSRYIHLNPYTSYLVKDFNELKDYPWSSLGEYLGFFAHQICEKKTLLSHFSSVKEFEKFIFDQKDYQRELGGIKYLVLETSRKKFSKVL